MILSMSKISIHRYIDVQQILPIFSYEYEKKIDKEAQYSGGGRETNGKNTEKKYGGLAIFKRYECYLFYIRL